MQNADRPACAPTTRQALLRPEKIREEASMDTVTLGAKGISVSLDLAVGHIADMEVEIDGRVLKPLHRAPWVGAPRATLPPDIPEGTVRLSGDFLCAPFSVSDVE
jgi:hypothetical protein